MRQEWISQGELYLPPHDPRHRSARTRYEMQPGSSRRHHSSRQDSSALKSHPPCQRVQQGADQPNPRRTKLRNGTFCGIFSAVRLGLQLLSIFRRRRSFFGGLRAGRSPARAPRSGAGGAQGGERPRPSDFWAVAGWERAAGPTRRAKWTKNWFALGS